MEKTMENPLSDIKSDLENLIQIKPKDQQDIEEWLGKLDLTFNQAVEAMGNIFDNKTLEKDIKQ